MKKTKQNPSWGVAGRTMKVPLRPKCVVDGCVNHLGDGEFVGVFCRPCYEFATTGAGTFSQSYRNALRRLGRMFGMTIGHLFVRACDPTEDVGIKVMSMADIDDQNFTKRNKV